MMRGWILGWCLALGAASLVMAEETMTRLPRPDFTPDPSDPPWLATAAQFHGHLGPWAAAGLRLGMAGREAVGARGYFDVDVEVLGPLDAPPRSCLIDGVQVATGATLGKRNIRWTQAEAVAVRVRNTRTGAVAVVHPTARLSEWLGSVQPRPLAAREASSTGAASEAGRAPTDAAPPARTTPPAPPREGDSASVAADDHDAAGEDADDDHDHGATASPAQRAAQARLERIARAIAAAKAEEMLRVERAPASAPTTNQR